MTDVVNENLILATYFENSSVTFFNKFYQLDKDNDIKYYYKIICSIIDKLVTIIICNLNGISY